MKNLSLVTVITAAFLLSGCWDNEKEKRASEFMSGLTKCDDCKLDKPLLGKKEDPQ